MNAHRRSIPTPQLKLLALAAILGAATLLSGACYQVVWRTDVAPLGRPAPGVGATQVRTPVKVHMTDGSTVIFATGVTISHDSIVGEGVVFALLSDAGRARGGVPMDSVVAVEAFQGKVLGAPTAVLTVAATAATVLGIAGLSVALFGSCPTLYAPSGDTLALQAEGFSYAIAPIMEHRDVDPLRVRAGAGGVLRFELRNEALETHFINHMEVLAVRHAPGERIVPDQGGRPVALGAFAPVVRAVDRAGRDVRRQLSAHDGRVYSTHTSVIEGATAGDLDDWIDLDVAHLPPGDSVAVLLRLRNSLLNTVLLYEGMLGGRDAIDWLSTGLEHIASTVDLARWYTATMGLRASISGGDGPGAMARISDVGPIAFRDVALVLPRAAIDAAGARIRLRFIADNWRIDEVRVAGRIARPTSTLLAVDSVVVPAPADGRVAQADTVARSALAAADDRYLETRPGQRLSLVFAPDTAPTRTDEETTYLIAWQGWYREWIRAAWLAEPTRTTPFVPGDAAVLEALHRWSAKKAAFERQFYSSKIPVR